jgi:DNA-binding GntR family transcriptional regulator
MYTCIHVYNKILEICKMVNLDLGEIDYNRKYLRDVVFETLQSAIMNGKLEQGNVITEQQISREFGISRTPVREALYKLTATGLIRIIPHKGFLISKWSIKEIRDVFEIRVVLERLAVELFIKNFHQENIEKLEEIIEKMEKAVQENNFMEAAKMNNQFHDLIIEKSDNQEIFNVMEPLKNKINIFRLISISTPARLKTSFAEHRSILASILKKDIENAKKLIEIHIRQVLTIIEKKLLEEKNK